MRQGFVPLKVPSNSDTNAVRLQRKATNSAALDSVPPIVNDVLASSGRPLDTTTRNFMEDRFGHDFSEVRVHTDSRAAESAQAVSAKAYTVGQNVVFGKDHYSPATGEGMRLFAHELAHVIQQGKSGQTSLSSLSHDNPGEQEADRAASLIDHCGGPIHVGISTARGLARQEDTDDELTRTLRAANRDAHKPKQEPFRDLSAFGTRPSGASVGQAAPRTQQRVDSVGLIAEQGTSLEASYRQTHFNSEQEALDFIDRYIAYTKDKPHLKQQYVDAVAARKRILSQKATERRKAEQDRLQAEREKADAPALKKQFQSDTELSQRTPPLGLSFLGPAYVQNYYRNPSPQIQNPLLRQQADLSTNAVAGHGALGTTALAVATGTVAAATVLALGAITLPVLISITAEAAAGSATLTPVVSAVLSNPIAVEEVGKFGLGVVLSIAAAGGIKNYLEQISTPEGALQVAFELFILHATIQSSSGGPPRQVIFKGKVEKATPKGISIRLTELPDVSDHPVLQGNGPGNDNLPKNVTPLSRPQAAAPPTQVAVGQSFDPSAQTQPSVSLTSVNRPTAATGDRKPSTNSPQAGSKSSGSSGSTPFGTPVPSLRSAFRAPPPITGNPKADRFEQSQRIRGKNSVYIFTGKNTPSGKPEHVEFDDFREADGMLIDAKARTQGAGSIYDVREPRATTDKPGFRQEIVRSKVLKQEAARQITGAKGVVWVVQDKEIANALRAFFAKEGFVTFRVEDPK